VRRRRRVKRVRDISRLHVVQDSKTLRLLSSTFNAAYVQIQESFLICAAYWYAA